MVCIMKVISHYEDDAEFLTRCFRLIGHLAFVEANLKVIVQYNGIQVRARAAPASWAHL
jgi:hypothetical protein